ncbi:MAG: apolipoprotein N-acyltransferase [Balneolales bacterium]|nr:apolipoprotein N-acyltransferase [Balneolales bacterium]
MKSNQFKYTILLSLLSGLLLGLSVNHVFGVSLAFLFPVCLIGIFAALEKQTTWKSWLLHGYVFSLVSLGLALIGFIWVEPVAGIVMVILMALFYALPFVLLFAIRFRLQTSSAFSFLLFGLIWPPFAWFVKELFLGFPITLYANALANYPVFIQFIDITGYTGISTWVITLNVGVFVLYKALLQKEFSNLLHNNRLKQLIAGTIIWFALPLLYAWYAYAVLPGTFQGSVKVAVIQSEYAEPDPEADDEAIFPILNTTLALTDSVITQHQPDLVVWPEGALPAMVRSDVNSLYFIADRVLRWQTPLATGIFDREPAPLPVPPLQQYLERDFFLYNAVAMITPQFAWKVLMEDVSGNPLTVYRKVNLMPFTEYVPLSDRYPGLSQFALDLGENNHFSAGESSSTQAFLTQNGRIVQTIPFICWDILFASTHKAEHLRNAQLITVHTSGRLFGDKLKTSIIGIKNYTRLRSVEARKSVAKSSTTGFSFFTNPFGEIIGMIDPFISGYSVGTVPLRRGLSFYSTYPHLFPIMCLVFLISIILKKSLYNSSTKSKKK